VLAGVQVSVEELWQRAQASQERARRLRERIAGLRVRALATRQNARVLRIKAARLTYEMQQAAQKRDTALRRVQPPR